MTNLEFYKDEIKEKIGYFLTYEDSYHSFLKGINSIYRQETGKYPNVFNIIDWLSEDYSDEELMDDFIDDIKYKINDIKLSLDEMLNKIYDLEEQIRGEHE